MQVRRPYSFFFLFVFVVKLFVDVAFSRYCIKLYNAKNVEVTNSVFGRVFAYLRQDRTISNPLKMATLPALQSEANAEVP